tara:strand:+ start:25 stop:198 length:174 start_codon:yes stop_codon:yes gene_type:complete
MLSRYTNYFGSLQEYLSDEPTISEISAFLIKYNFKIVKKSKAENIINLYRNKLLALY